MASFDVILPAGGRIGGALADRAGTEVKALIEIGGEPILARTLRVLKEGGIARRAVVIGSSLVLGHPAAEMADIRLEEGATGPDNIFRGLDALLESDQPPERVMVVTTDLPFLTAELLRRFVDACPPDGDICLPLITKAGFQERFPGSTATFIPLKDDIYTAGCAYLMNVPAMMSAKPHIDRVFENRKSKLGMATLLGPAFVVKWLTKRLTLEDVEAKIRAMLACSGRAVRNSPPELAFDIDDLDDYEYALQEAERQ